MIRSRRTRTKNRFLAVGGALLALAATLVGCSKKPAADLAEARPVMAALLEAEREHRGSRGVYWRDPKLKLDRLETMKALGVDIGDAPSFDFTVDPPESGLDPKLRVTARGRDGASGVFLSCLLEATAPKPDCTESSGAPAS